MLSQLSTSISRLFAYLSYREPYIKDNITYRYYSIGSCIIAVIIVGIVALTIAVTVASFEPVDLQ